jgi:carboxyl-terminal processing protease
MTHSKIRPKILLATVCFAFFAMIAFVNLSIYQFRPAIDEVCQTVTENYFDQSVLQNFQKSCEDAKDNFPKFMSAHATVKYINDILAGLKISHLFLYEPEENLQIWLHESVDNGLRARDINGAVVVYEVLKASSGDKAGVLIGDQIVSVDRSEIHFSGDLFGRSGRFMLIRKNHAIEIEIKAEKFEEEDSFEIRPLDSDIALLRVKSFLSADFEQEKLDAAIRRTLAFKELIIDLRGNIGGSFPAMVRLLSAFTCRDELIGRLMISNTHKIAELELKDDLEAESQLSQIESAQKINLRTHHAAQCFTRKLWVMIDHQTSSVSEIFADHLQRRRRARVLGEVSAGQVVMAKWFGMGTLGHQGFSLSVPIANYLNFQSEALEEFGVRPEKKLFYSLPQALQGRDSWVDEILKVRHKAR